MFGPVKLTFISVVDVAARVIMTVSWPVPGPFTWVAVKKLFLSTRVVIAIIGSGLMVLVAVVLTTVSDPGAIYHFRGLNQRCLKCSNGLEEVMGYRRLLCYVTPPPLESVVKIQGILIDEVRLLYMLDGTVRIDMRER
jgi:hypothetical protein